MDGKICKKCLIRDMEEKDRQMLKKYKDAIRREDRVSEEEYEARLSVCKECGKLNAGTCAACGCYVELRALSPIGRCPYAKW